MKNIRESKANLHIDNIEYACEELRKRVYKSKVTYFCDGEDCFIDVEQKGNVWSFCVDFGANEIWELEPKEDVVDFDNDYQIATVIKNLMG